MSGRSSERLVEEVSQCSPNSIPQYVLTPIEQYQQLKTGTGPIGLSTPGYTADLPLAEQIFHAIFPDTQLHIQIEKYGLAGDVEHDWRTVFEESHSRRATLRCSLTGAELRLDWYSSEIPMEVRDTFDIRSLKKRFEASSGAEFAVESGPTPEDCAKSWMMYTRVVSDLITVRPDERRSISAAAQRPSTLLDLPVVLPFLGFHFDKETNLFVPPRQDSQQYINWLRRVLLEIRIQFQRRPLIPELSTFLGCELPHNDPNLVAEYACLGATSFSDDRIWQRYLLSSQSDPAGVPWYLESLSAIAQSRQSETLEMHVMELVSLGVPTISNISRDLARLDLDVATVQQLTDEELAELVLNAGDSVGEPVLKSAALLRQQQQPEVSPNLRRVLQAADSNIEDALGVFGEDIEENFIQIWDNGTPCDKLEARLILRTLAFAGGSSASVPSLPLLSLYERVSPEALPPLETAYAMLEIPDGGEVSDNSIMAIFLAVTEDVGRDKLLELRRALRAIATYRESDTLWQFLGYSSDRSASESDSQRPKLPPGLWNIGNTCYLNSLLQFYYSLPDVRNYVESVEVSEEIEGESEKDVEFMETGEKVKFLKGENPESDEDGNETHSMQDADTDDANTKDDIEADSTEDAGAEDGQFKDVELKDAEIEDTDTEDVEANAKDAYAENTKTNTKHADTQDADTQDDTLDANDIVEDKEYPKSTPNEVSPSRTIGGRKVPPNEVYRSKVFVSLLGKLFREIGSSTGDHVTPSDLLAYMALVPPQEDANDVVTSGAQSLRGRLAGALQRQQDVTECIENVLDQLEATMPAYGQDSDGEQLDLVKTLFYGTTVQVLQRLSDGGNRRLKTERFSSLLVDVGAEANTLYTALDGYFANDVLELEDGPTLRTLRVSKLPKILQVQVQRVQFDKTTYMPYKNLNPLEFDEVVYMDRYLNAEEGSSLEHQQTAANRLKEELAKVNLELSQSQTTIAQRKQALDTTVSWLRENSIEVKHETVAALEKCSAAIGEKLDSLLARQRQLKQEIASTFDGFRQHGYRLHALFIHKGDVSYGHYWIYIRNQETGEFLKYNDEFVSQATREEVFCFDRQPATPYFLVFVAETTD